MVTRCVSIDTPKTLKAGLEFLSKLNDLRAASTLGKALEDKVKGAIKKLGCKEVELEKLFTKDITKNLGEVLQGVAGLPSVIVNNGSSYGRYQGLNIEKCNEEVATILLELIPKLYNTLLYLTYQVSGGLKNRGGGGWAQQKCKPSRDEEEELHNWLTDKNYTSDIILRRGYNEDELSNIGGSTLYENLMDILDGEGDVTCFSKLIVAIIFATSLTPESTATALVLVMAFCKAVATSTLVGNLSDSRLTGLKNICSKVRNILRCIAPGNGGVRAAYLIACEGAVDYCTNMLKPDYFHVYISWLKKNLQGIIQNLQKMGAAGKVWDNNMFEYAMFAGPFPFGFMLGNGWNDGPYVGQERLSNAIEKLIEQSELKGSLWTLLKCINPDSESIVYNEQPQQETPTAEAEKAAVSVPAESGSGPGSSTASDMVSETHGGVFVASTAAEVQSGRNSGIEGGEAGLSAGIGTTTSSLKYPDSFTDTGTTGQQGEAATTLTPRGQGSGATNSSGEGSGHTEGTRHSDRESQRQTMPAQHGSSGAPHESDNAGSVTDGDSSTITIGGAAGGVALLGGVGAALYFLNVGGIKTLITGVP
ncbi:secreted antigen 1 [Babesia caballi]|uniref:Secreted antigen 1 n=1 Tax=Babesia caballi TaxID=5871 RepID=A0AAV4LLA9_BABCB|nr:secreted antigen 1 [Babesia caballi]